MFHFYDPDNSKLQYESPDDRQGKFENVIMTEQVSSIMILSADWKYMSQS